MGVVERSLGQYGGEMFAVGRRAVEVARRTQLARGGVGRHRPEIGGRTGADQRILGGLRSDRCPAWFDPRWRISVIALRPPYSTGAAAAPGADRGSGLENVVGRRKRSVTNPKGEVSKRNAP